jgi:nucleoid DNA-binding protein
MKMNERLTTRTLAHLLADQTGLDSKRAEEFINAISSYFIQGLEKNKMVKIFGLGMFKIVLVRERESVHIQTGERFVIPAHHKLTFVPDKDFKEQINRPFALFEPIEAKEANERENEDTVFEEAAAIVEENKALSYSGDYDLGYLEDIDSYDEQPEIETLQGELTKEEDLYEEALQEGLPQEEVLYEENLNEDLGYEFVHGNVTFTNELPPEANVTISDDPFVRTSDKEDTIDTKFFFFSSNKKKNRVLMWLYLLSIPLFASISLFFGAYFFLQKNTERSLRLNQTQEILENVSRIDDSEPLPIGVVSPSDDEPQDVQELDNTQTNDNPTLVTPNEESRNETVPSSTNATQRQEGRSTVDWIAPSSENTRTQTRRVIQPNREIEERNKALANTSGSAARTTTDNSRNTTTPAATTSTANAKALPARVRMAAGSSLTQIAAEYYGDRLFWVYIYEHNRSRIKNFENIPAGTELQLPAPNVYGIDAKSSASLQRAREKQRQLMSRGN